MQGLNLNDLLKTGQADYVDNSDYIKKIKHSPIIREDIRKLDALRKEHKENPTIAEHDYWNLCQTTCPFLFMNYTDIFNRLYKSELDVSLMYLLLDALEKVENGDKTQEESSVLLGQLLADIYANSAHLRGEKLDKEHETPAKEFVQGKSTSWLEWKKSTEKSRKQEKEKKKREEDKKDIERIMAELSGGAIGKGATKGTDNNAGKKKGNRKA